MIGRSSRRYLVAAAIENFREKNLRRAAHSARPAAMVGSVRAMLSSVNGETRFFTAANNRRLLLLLASRRRTVRAMTLPILHASWLLGASLFFQVAARAADLVLPSTNYVIIAPNPGILLERQRHLEWSARMFETLLGMRPPMGRVTFSDAPAGAQVNADGSAAALVNAFPLTRQPPAPDGTVWNLSWFALEMTAAGPGNANFSVLTHEAAHLQLIFTANFHSAQTLKARFNGYGSFLPDWLDEAVAVFHEPDALRASRRSRFRVRERIPFPAFFTMEHPGRTGTSEVMKIRANSAEEARKKVAAFQASQEAALKASNKAMTDTGASVEAFYNQALAVSEYLVDRGGLPFFRFVLIEQNNGRKMDDILRAWPKRQRQITAERSAVERAAGSKPPLSAVTKGDPAGPRPPRANAIAGVLVRPGEALNPMPPSVGALEADFVEWVRIKYPRYAFPFTPFPGN